MREKYAAIMSPVLANLDRHVKWIESRANDSEHSRAFADGPARALCGAIDKFRTRSSHFERCWGPFRDLQRDLGEFMRRSTLSLARISPRLSSLRGTSIPMPGLGEFGAKVAEKSSERSAGAERGGGRSSAAVCVERIRDELVRPRRISRRYLLLRMIPRRGHGRWCCRRRRGRSD